MGCDQSRDKTKEADANTFAKAADFAVATPLPLHIYEEYTKAYTIFNLAPSPTNSSPSNQSSSPSAPSLPSSPSTPKSQASPKSLASPKRSLSMQRSSSIPKTSKAFHNMSATRLTKLHAIAQYKFNKFHKFSKLVKEEILLHIDKELRLME